MHSGANLQKVLTSWVIPRTNSLSDDTPNVNATIQIFCANFIGADAVVTSFVACSMLLAGWRIILPLCIAPLTLKFGTLQHLPVLDGLWGGGRSNGSTKPTLARFCMNLTIMGPQVSTWCTEQGHC